MKTKPRIRQNKDKLSYMENAPVGQLIWEMSAPSIVGVLAYNAYNLFDTLFISQWAGTAAVGGVSVSFPFFLFLSAVSSTVGSGAASVISRELGRQNMERAAKTAANAFMLFYASALFVTVFGLLFLDELLHMIGVTETLMPYAKQYTGIILIGAVTSTGFSSLIRAEGSSRYAMLIWVIPLSANILLDLLFIFGLKMGVAGAALGTVLSQCISMGMSFYYFFLSGRSRLHIQLKHFRPDMTLLREIVFIGFPSFLQLSGTSFSLIAANRFLRQYGDDLAISVYGLVNKIDVFFRFPVSGLIQGIQPIIGQNYGAGKRNRVREIMKLSGIVTAMYGILICMITAFCSPQLMQVFTADSDVITLGSHVLPPVMAEMLFLGMQSLLTCYFQATGRKAVSFLLVFCNQFLCFIPAAWILAVLFGLSGIWYAFPVSAAVSLGITVCISLWAQPLYGKFRQMHHNS